MIKVYSKPNCQNCDKTKQFLKDWNVDFEEINVMENESALNYIKMLGFTSLPVVETKYDTWVGHNTTKLMQVIGRSMADE